MRTLLLLHAADVGGGYQVCCVDGGVDTASHDCPSPSFHSQLVAMEVGMEVVMVVATEEEEEEEDMKEEEGL